MGGLGSSLGRRAKPTWARRVIPAVVASSSRNGPSESEEATMSAELKEMMIIEVNYGKGKDDILVHFGDDPTVLAQKFVAEHNLKPSAVGKIAGHIDSTMKAFQSSNTEMRPQSPSIGNEDEIRVNDFNSSHNNNIPQYQQPPSENIDRITPNKGNNTTATTPIATPLPVSPIKKVTPSSAPKTTDNVMNQSNINAAEINRSGDPNKGLELIRQAQERIAARKNAAANNIPTKVSVSNSVAPTMHSTNSNENHIKANSTSAYVTKPNIVVDKPKAPSIYSNESSNIDDKERMYSRLKLEYSSVGGSTIAASSQGSNKSDAPKPVSSSLGLNSRTKSKASPTKPKSSDRLYRHALMLQQRKNNMIKKASNDMAEKLKTEKFKLNSKSKEIISNPTVGMKYKYSEGDTLERFYQEGVKEIKNRKNAIERPTRIETWTCSKCGNLNTYICHSDDDLLNEKHLECCNQYCKFVQPFITSKPINVPVVQGSADVREACRRRWTSTTGENSLHELLYADSHGQNAKLDVLRQQWAEIDSWCTFKPIISEGSEQILKAVVDSDDGGENAIDTNGINDNRINVPLGKYFTLPVTERLTKYNLKPDHPSQEKNYIDMILSNPNVQLEKNKHIRNEDDISRFVNKMAYEYRKRQAKRQAAQREANLRDPKSGKPFFTPRPNDPDIHPRTKQVRSPGTLAKIDESNKAIQARVSQRKTASDGSTLDIHDYLLKCHEEIQRRKNYIEHKSSEIYINSIDMKQASALPQSDIILKDALARSIEEMYRLLLATIKYDEMFPNVNSSDKAKADAICKLSAGLENWHLQQLDLAKVHPSMMITEVKSLIIDIKDEKAHAGKFESLIVSFDEFCELVRKCINRRNGPGKRYVYVPKKRPDVSIELINKIRKEETFQPVINKTTSTIVSRDTKRTAAPIEELLLEEGKRVKEKVDRKREEKEAEEEKACTFEPAMYRPPKYIKPRYRGVKESVKNYELEKVMSTLPPPPSPRKPLSRKPLSDNSQNSSLIDDSMDDSIANSVNRRASGLISHKNSKAINVVRQAVKEFTGLISDTIRTIIPPLPAEIYKMKQHETKENGYVENDLAQSTSITGGRDLE